MGAGERTGADEIGGAPPALPAVRIAPTHELAGAARTAPLLRQARRLARWAAAGPAGSADGIWIA